MEMVPAGALKESLEDIKVFAFTALHSAEVALTQSVIGGIEKWFSNVEVVYPIMEVDFDAAEKAKLIQDVTDEMIELLSATYLHRVTNVLTQKDYDAFCVKLDSLWRELTGCIASELNELFKSRAVPAESVEDATRMIKEVMSQAAGSEEEAEAFLKEAKADPFTRTNLRRIGINPDSL